MKYLDIFSMKKKKIKIKNKKPKVIQCSNNFLGQVTQLSTNRKCFCLTFS